MIQGKQVKIIKRAEAAATNAALPEKRQAVAQESGQTVKRDMATVVTGWVREMRRKKTEEAARGFESLFDKAA